MFNGERADQYRGVPFLAPVVSTIKQLTRYTEAEIMAAVINSMSDAAVVMIHNTQAAWGRETYKLVKTVQKMYPVIQFLKDRYFPDGPVYYSEKALIEFKKKGRKIAPFVIPLINGIVMEKDGYRTDIVDAPYIAPKCVITAKELEKKAFGESPESGRSPEQRENEIESECIDDNRKAILRRHEQMCAELLLTGQVMMKHYATAEDAARGENYDLKYLR